MLAGVTPAILLVALYPLAVCELLPLPTLAVNSENQLGAAPSRYVAWASEINSRAEAAICFRGQLRGLATRDLFHIEQMVLSRLFLSGDVFAVVPLEECQAAISIYGAWSAESLLRAWHLRQVICTPSSLSAQEERFAGSLGPPISYTTKRNLAIEMRLLKLCGEATKQGQYTWVLLIRPDFTWCHSPSRSMLGNFLLIPRETENEWFIGGSTESVLGPSNLVEQYCNWYDTVVRNETFWFVLRSLRLNTGSSLKSHFAKFGPPFTHEQTLDLYLFMRQLPIVRTSSFSRFRTSLCKSDVEHCCQDTLTPSPDSRGIWSNTLSHGMNPRFVARRVRAGYDFFLAGALVSFFRRERQINHRRNSSSLDFVDGVLDLGCGSGTYALELNSHSIPCLCLDGDANAGHVIRMDFAGLGGRAVVADMLTWKGCRRRWSWVLLLDVMHFHPLHQQEAILKRLRRCAAFGVVLSWAPPGQGLQRWGTEHVHLGELSSEKVTQRLAHHGLVRDYAADAGLALAVLQDRARENLLVFRKRPYDLAHQEQQLNRTRSSRAGTVSKSEFPSFCNSAVMDVVDPLVPQTGSIWAADEACELTLVQLRSFLFLSRSIYHTSEIAVQASRSFATEWRWIKSKLQHNQLDGLIGRWDLGAMLMLMSKLLSCKEAHHASGNQDILRILDLDVVPGLCEGMRFGIWRRVHETWRMRRTRAGWARPQPFSFECSETGSGTAAAWARLCEGKKVMLNYRQAVRNESPWFSWRHLLLLEQVYFSRLATTADVVPWTH